MWSLPPSLPAAWLIIALFFSLEPLLRRGGEARSLNAGAADRQTTRLLGAGYALVIAGGPLLSWLGVGRLPGAVAWAGVALMPAGLLLRARAMRALGAAYSRTLRVSAGQQVVRTGPYRFVRHPGYLGSLLFWAGAGLAAASWPAAAAALVLMAAVYARRIRVEEAMLAAAFGEQYRRYCEQTWRLLPFLY